MISSSSGGKPYFLAFTQELFLPAMLVTNGLRFSVLFLVVADAVSVWLQDSEMTNRAAYQNGYSFVKWESEYKNSRSRAICRCSAGHEYPVSVIKIVNCGRRCPKCAIKLRSSSQIMPAELRIADIERMGNKFVKWDGEFTNSKTKAVVECESGHQWSASINNLVNHGKGCPACFPGGFNQTKSGFVYALRSECGTMIKVGVSNNPKSRIPKLRSETPFDFGVIMMLGMSGIDAIRAERYFHAKYKSVGMRGFNGATEWLVTTGELLNEIREMGR